MKIHLEQTGLAPLRFSKRAGLTCRILVFSFALLAFDASPAIYKEAGGIVVVEAEHFDSRTDNASDAHHWAIIPDESGNPDTPVDQGFVNARGDKYMQSLPDGGANNNAVDRVSIDPFLDFKVQITTPGEYRLWLRWGGWDGASDSIYGQIVEMRTPGGPGPDWYRFARSINADFNTTWDGSGAPSTDTANNVSAGGGEVPAVWTLSAGTYTIRLTQREDGSAVDAVILQLSNLAAPGTPGPAESATASAFITIGQQPQDISVAAGQSISFTIAANGSGTPAFQWQRAAPGSTNFVNIPGATSATYSPGTLTLAESGTRFRAVVTVPGLSINSREATAIVDVTAPIAYRAEGSPTFDRVKIVFSEPVDPASGTNLSNYTVSGLTLSAASLSADGRNALLVTSKQTTGTVYTVTVKDIKDRVTPPNTLSPNPTTLKFTGWVLARGGVLHKFWDNITVNTLDTLRNDPRFPDNPTFTTIEPAYEYPPNGGNEAGSNYGNQLSGLIMPPITGDYVFFTCSDDPSELFLSTDESPANKKLIAQETQWSNAREWVTSGGPSDNASKRSDQFAATEWPAGNTITLTAGKLYYIESLHTEGGGGDNVGATWQLPGAAEPVNGALPIQGTNLWTYMNPDVSTATVRLTAPSEGATFAVGAPITITAEATDTNGPVRRVDFFAGSNLIGSSTNAPFSLTVTNLSAGRYPIVASALDRSGFVITSASIGIVVGTPPPEVLMVVANGTGPEGAPNPGDQLLITRLQSMGYVVTTRGALASQTADANGKILIVTSSTVPSGDVGNKFRSVAVPVFNWEQALQDNYLFTLDQDTVTRGTTTGQTDVEIVTPSHPIAAGLSGVVTIADSPVDVGWGVPAPAAKIIAKLTDGTDHPALYAYEKGDTLIDGATKAPARRVHFPASDATFEALNTNGWKIVEAALNWLVPKVTAQPKLSITLSGIQATITSSAGGTVEATDSLSAPNWQAIGLAPQTVQATNRQRFFRVRQ